MLGRAGLPDGFIALGLLAVLPGAVPVVPVGPVPVIAPDPVVPEGVPTLEAAGALVPLEVEAAPPAWANAALVERANAPANAMVLSFMIVSSLVL